MMSAFSSATISGPPSRGRPAPSRIRPTRSVLTGSLKTSPMKVTPDSRSILAVPSKTCTITKSSEVSRTCPFLMVPLESRRVTISPNATGSVLFKKTRGPFTSVMVRYSFPVMIFLSSVFLHRIGDFISHFLDHSVNNVDVSLFETTSHEVGTSWDVDNIVE